MELIIAAEHFALTDAIRAHVETSLERVKSALPQGSSIRVFLSMPSPRDFKVLYRVHSRDKETVVREEGPELYSLVTHSSTVLRKQLFKVMKKDPRPRRSAEHELP